MAWIRTIPEEQATGLVKQVYDERKQKAGFVENIRKALSLRPEVLYHYDQLANTLIFGGSRLGRRREELVAVVVSSKLHCSYWTIAHGEFLRKALDGESELVLKVLDDYHSAGLEPEEIAMLEYAEKITVNPASVDQEDVEKLRVHGFQDEEIYDICVLTAYRNFVSRIAEGLGVALDGPFAAMDEEFKGALMVGREL